jgi:hypothetical protein
MATTFPGAIDSYSTKVDNVDDVEAAHINDLQDAVVAIETVVQSQPAPPNLLYQSLSHDTWLEGDTFNDIADDTYVAGLWNCIHNGNPPDVSKSFDTDGLAAITCAIDQDNTQVGFLQFLLASDTGVLQGKTLSFQIELQANFAVATNFRVAILGWSGSANALTSDVVSAWDTSPNNPTLAAGWEYLGVSDDIPGTSEVVLTVEGVLLDDPNINNIAVFVWNSDEGDSGDDFDLSRAKLERSAVATEFSAPLLEEEKRRVGQFVTALDASNAGSNQGIGNKASTTVLVPTIIMPAPMWTPPTSFAHNISGYTAGAPTTTTIAALNQSAQAFFAITGALTVTSTVTNSYMAALLLTAGTSWNGTVGDLMSVRLGPDVVAIFSARL